MTFLLPPGIKGLIVCDQSICELVYLMKNYYTIFFQNLSLQSPIYFVPSRSSIMLWASPCITCLKKNFILTVNFPLTLFILWWVSYFLVIFLRILYSGYLNWAIQADLTNQQPIQHCVNTAYGVFPQNFHTGE